ncbi:hypothetical protein CcI6DRAFT_04168 [Frankia sp. CcI6]|uniref:hypothetical protein n=2 Tax=Frankia TaxID=1854 RepID=UPI0003D00D95|nr:hypothetical protein [Frankia casuarinae]ETA00413.1 hypothetical protein CcI6DRAFT_04168 [Frankia sp. CcI6]OAA20068.1 hypothetical protein AAY23_109820 [Frankia casuarinae]OHV51112.1 hypothetical protein CgIS1_19580 [Frankia sp. CgIS1]
MRRRKIQDVANMFRSEARLTKADRRKLAARWGQDNERLVETFIGRHFAEIYYVLTDARAEGLWFADADERMMTRQQDADMLRRSAREAFLAGNRVPVRNLEAAEAMRANAAKELGQYLPPEPPRPAPVEFHIEVDGASLADIARPAHAIEPGPAASSPRAEADQATPPDSLPGVADPTSWGAGLPGGVAAPHEEPTPELAPAEEPWVNVFDREEL